MKAWMYVLALLSGLLYLTGAASQKVDISNLPKEERAEILAKTMVSEQKTQTPIPEQAKQWAELGTAIGTGIVATAQQLGVAANDFAKTDLGKITVVILIWKYIGKEIKGVVVGLLILLLGIPFGWYQVIRVRKNRVTQEYVYVPYLWGLVSLKRVSKVVEHRASTTDEEGLQIVIGYITMAVSSLIGFIVII